MDPLKMGQLMLKHYTDNFSVWGSTGLFVTDHSQSLGADEKQGQVHNLLGKSNITRKG